MHISRSFQRCLGTCAHSGAGILSDEIDAQPSDNGAGVVPVQTVKGEAVVEQSRRLMEHLTSHLEVHLGPCLSDRLCGCQELIERWADGAVRHTVSLSVRPRPGPRLYWVSPLVPISSWHHAAQPASKARTTRGGLPDDLAGAYGEQRRLRTRGYLRAERPLWLEEDCRTEADAALRWDVPTSVSLTQDSARRDITPSTDVPLSLMVRPDPGNHMSAERAKELAAAGFTVRSVSGAGDAVHLGHHGPFLAALAGWL